MEQGTMEQRRVAKVLERLAELAAEDGDLAEQLLDHMDDMLDDMNCSDAFGTEGQNHPYGDMRDKEWSKDEVQGIDD